MIHYPCNENDFLNLIRAEYPNWLKKADKIRQTFEKSGCYVEHSEFYGSLKPILMRLQYSKCIYCERRLEGPEVGKIEWDLEHFRPKRRVDPWFSDDFPYPTGGGSSIGYYQLAYHPLNFLAACKPCNSILKKCYFPIEGSRGPMDSKNPSQLKSEKALFVYPLGQLDESPARLFRFYGPRIMPQYQKGRRFRRARAMILCFQLNRKTLLLERSERIETMWQALKLEMAGIDAHDALSTQKRLCSKKSPHAGCARAFLELFRLNFTEAETVYQSVKGLLGRP